MVKVGMITFHFVNNFGGVLQAYALGNFIEKEYDVKVTVIDYRNPFIMCCDVIRLFPITTNIREILSGALSMKQRVGRYSKVKNFISRELAVSKRCLTYAGLKRIQFQYTHYLAGSDQIWNSDITFGIDWPYYLGFVGKERKKISYAASFGRLNLSVLQKKKIRKYLSGFDAVSVREGLCSKKVEKIIKKKVERLIDPVFLLSRSEWERMNSSPAKDGEYILLYMMQFDKSIYELARRIKEKTGKKIVEISRYGFRRKFVDKIYVNIGPKEFVGLFQNAGYVCTNSYHGIIFSLIFEKDLYLVRCKRFQERMNDLFEIFELHSLDFEPLHQIHYDRQRVRDVILKERKKAYEYLRRNLIEDND